MVLGALTRCTLLHSVCDLKTIQMNVQHSIIQEDMLYDIKLGHIATEATKTICCAKGNGTVNRNTVTR